MSVERDAWVIYDSVHGNTRAVAEAIADGLRDGGPVHVVPTAEADLDRVAQARAVVIGCPTHGFSLSPGMKELAAGLTAGRLDGVPVAVFDTRFSLDDMPNRFLTWLVPRLGTRAWAAPKLARAAKRAGAVRLAEPAAFHVRDIEGPLAEGELDRASAWGRDLATRAA